MKFQNKLLYGSASSMLFGLFCYQAGRIHNNKKSSLLDKKITQPKIGFFSQTSPSKYFVYPLGYHYPTSVEQVAWSTLEKQDIIETITQKMDTDGVIIDALSIVFDVKLGCKTWLDNSSSDLSNIHPFLVKMIEVNPLLKEMIDRQRNLVAFNQTTEQYYLRNEDDSIENHHLIEKIITNVVAELSNIELVAVSGKMYSYQGKFALKTENEWLAIEELKREKVKVGSTFY